VSVNASDLTLDGLDVMVQWAAVVGAAAAAVQGIAVVIALIYAFRQIRESTHSRRATIALYLLDRLSDQDRMLRRRRLYRKIARRIEQPSEKDERLLSQISNEYEAIGFIVSQGLVDEGLVLALHYGSVTRAWNVMKPWIVTQRKNRGTVYARFFENLKDRAEAYISRNHLTYPNLFDSP
jgi:hypothetical protein